jgi:hypothetical protein
MLIGCRQDDRLSVAPSPGPSPTPSASAASAPPASSPTSSAAVGTTSAPTGIAVDTAVRTVIGDLQARSAPGLGASSAKIEPLLPRGTRLFVAAGPVAADGSDWYQVMSFDGVYPGVWVALTGPDGVPWLESDTQPCPTPPLDAAALLSLKPYGGLACYGGREIQVVGDFHCELADVDRSVSGPDWLWDDRYCAVDLGGGETMEIFAAGITGLAMPTTERAVISGHFDDRQATSCVYALDPPAPDPATIVVSCRAMFVATALEPAP